MQDIIRIFTQLPPFEWLAAALGVTGVWGTMRGKLWGYLVGNASVVLYCWVCYEAGLYANMGVNAYYFFANIYGWCRWWRHKRKKGNLSFGYCSVREYCWIVGGLLGAFGLLYYVLVQYTDSQLVLWDAITTAIYVVAMILMAHRRIENWIGWIIGDLIAIPLYFSLGLYFTTAQFAVFLVLAMMGYMRWRRLYLASCALEKSV